MIRKTDEKKADPAAVTVGEDAYKLLHLFCPFCGKPDRCCCEHRLFVTQLDAFEHIKPAFESFMRMHYSLDADEEVDDIVPKTLWGRFKNVEEMAIDAAEAMNAELPDGPAAIVIRVANRRRHDRRTVCFASDLGLAWLAKQGAPNY